MDKSTYTNRLITPIPAKPLCIKIIIKDADGETAYICEWIPTNSTNNNNLLGTAKVIYGRSKGIGFNVWNVNESEFIYYKIIETDI